MDAFIAEMVKGKKFRTKVLQGALQALYECQYDVTSARLYILQQPLTQGFSPWLPLDNCTFEQGLRERGKDFAKLQSEFVGLAAVSGWSDLSGGKYEAFVTFLSMIFVPTAAGQECAGDYRVLLYLEED